MSRLDKLSQIEDKGRRCRYAVEGIPKLTSLEEAFVKICKTHYCESCTIPETIHVKSKLTVKSQYHKVTVNFSHFSYHIEPIP